MTTADGSVARARSLSLCFSYLHGYTLVVLREGLKERHPEIPDQSNLKGHPMDSCSTHLHAVEDTHNFSIFNKTSKDVSWTRALYTSTPIEDTHNVFIANRSYL